MVYGFGFRISGFGFRVQGSGFRVQGFALLANGLCTSSSSKIGMPKLSSRVTVWAQDLGSRAQGLGFRVEGLQALHLLKQQDGDAEVEFEGDSLERPARRRRPEEVREPFCALLPHLVWGARCRVQGVGCRVWGERRRV